MKSIKLSLAVLLMLFFSGCIYVHTREPLTLNMDRTPVSSVEKQGSVKLVSFPRFGGAATPLVAWGNAAIAQVAKEQGMQEVYFADLEIFRVLRVWNEYTVHVYGK